jgi:peptidoglycan/LPS O-acetylase OafA/YrhL
MPNAGRILLTLVALTTAVGGYIADWNETHVYNPKWPPHAKFHNGQTLSTGVLLGCSALYYVFRSQPSPAIERESLYAASWLLSLNYVAQLSAVLYPGSLPVDPEFGKGFPQAYISAVLFCLIAAGAGLEIRRLNKLSVSKRE